MPNYRGLWSSSQQFQARGQGLWPRLPGTPTIGTATAGGSNCASVAFTAPADPGVPATLTYIATSTPGCISSSGGSSPVVVTGLTTGTSYTFKVRARNNAGSSGCSAASNSITAALVTCATFTTAGTYSWVAPAGVCTVSAVVIGGGGGGRIGPGGRGGGGGGLGWRNTIAVTPGTSYTVIVGAGGPLNSTSTNGGCSQVFTGLVGGGGQRGANCGQGGGYTASCGGGGGYGGQGWYGGTPGGGGGGAGGYTGNGGVGGYGCGSTSNPGGTGTGGGGNGGGGGYYYSYGYVVYYFTGYCGQGASVYGTSGTPKSYGGGGGGGGYYEYPCTCCYGYLNGTAGVSGAVRIVWAGGSRGTPAFPSTNVGP